MDQILRGSLIEALKSRSWTHLDAERAADSVATFYEDGEGEWRVRLNKITDELDLYLVARNENEVSVFDSPLEGRARDVASALNELDERDNSDATGTR